jgi:D-alanyl-D-alanine carboxypeptidase/D-alanyl-D-alanine-endopeptidase (penicillin-binding protein 4)
MKCRIVIVLLFIAFSLKVSANELVDRFPELQSAGVLLVDTHGEIVISAHAQTKFIPASTTKLVTAWLALNHWGEDHHFKTDFYLDDSTNTLWVKGSGDPFLVSEELLMIAKNLKNKGLQQIDAIGLDDSLFQNNLNVPGASTTTNPYDAKPTAIAANFNTLAVRKKAGRIVSAESQTPLTAFSEKMARQQSLSKRITRVNTGASSQDAERYFAELLAAFLRQQGVVVGKQIIWGIVPNKAPYYTHSNSKKLTEVIRPMMKYSTNFIANQLILVLSSECYQRPANFSDVERYMSTRLQDKFNWKTIVLKEGAGLSRDNQISPTQMVQLLEAFRPWKDLLPEVAPGIYAKSGTLKNVSTLAGYTVDRNQQWNAFTLMMQQSVSHKRRNQIANEFVIWAKP